MKKILFLAVLLSLLSLTYCKKLPEEEPGEGDPTEQTDPPGDPGDPQNPEDDPQPPADETILVSDILITPSEDVSLEVTETVQLSAEVTPENATDKSVSWSSTDPTVASVDDKGLVKALKVGTTTIYVRSRDEGATAVKEITVFQPLPNHFTSIEITSPNKDDSHFYEDRVGPAYKFKKEEVFKFEAKGYPEGTDDEIEFLCTELYPAFTISSDGMAHMLGGCGAPTTANPFTYQNYMVYARSVKYPTVKSKPVYIYIEGPEVQRAVLRPFMPAYPIVSPSKYDLRHSKYIGRGRIQDFTILIESKSATSDDYYYSSPADFTIYDHTGVVEFETYTYSGFKILRAHAPYNAPISSASKTEQSTVTIQIGTYYKRTLTFNVSELDPYIPKVGDGIPYKGEGFYDGGNRGNDLFETLTYQRTPTANTIIAWIGEEHLREDALYAEYCKGGIKGTGGKVTHGIAIPVNTDHLYRSNKTNGEVFSDDRDNLKNSSDLPTWFTDKDLLPWHTGYKMTAFTNTCALVYRNRKCGTSHDVKPINFFVEKQTLQPTVEKGTKNDEKNLKISDFSWESDFYGNYDEGNLKSNTDKFSKTSIYGIGNKEVESPWLLPSLKDLYHIFSYETPTVDDLYKNVNYEWVMTGYPVSVKDKINILRKCLPNFLPRTATLPTYTWSYWTCQQSMEAYAPVFTISDGKATVSLKKKESDRAYVLPIVYF